MAYLFGAGLFAASSLFKRAHKKSKKITGFGLNAKYVKNPCYW